MYTVLVGKPEGKRHIGRPWRRWKIILERIMKNSVGRTWTGLIWLRIGTSGVIL